MFEFIERSGLLDNSPYFKEAYEQASGCKGCPLWLSSSYILHLGERWGILEGYMTPVLSALEKIQTDEQLVIFLRAVYIMLQREEPYETVFKGFSLPKALSEGEEHLELLGLFPILACVEGACEALMERGVPEAIVRRSYGEIDVAVYLSSLRTGCPSLNLRYFLWSILYAKGRLLRLGRLCFELCPQAECGIKVFLSSQGKIQALMDGVRLTESGRVAFGEEKWILAEVSETESDYEGYPVKPETALAALKKVQLSKQDWKPVLSPQDAVLSVHIPAGEPMTKENCQEAYALARQVFSSAFPEYEFKAFVCFSWLLSKDLEKLLRPESNILKFAEPYSRFPYETAGFDVFSFVFQKEFSSVSEIDFDALPETNSLMRQIKSLYQQGEVIREAGGFFLFEE